MRPRAAFGLIFLVLLAARLCHTGILWPEETFPSAAAAQLLDGKTLYRDVWFDKPPLLGWAYLAWGALPGWPLRLAGARGGYELTGLRLVANGVDQILHHRPPTGRGSISRVSGCGTIPMADANPA